MDLSRSRLLSLYHRLQRKKKPALRSSGKQLLLFLSEDGKSPSRAVGVSEKPKTYRSMYTLGALIKKIGKAKQSNKDWLIKMFINFFIVNWAIIFSALLHLMAVINWIYQDQDFCPYTINKQKENKSAFTSSGKRLLPLLSEDGKSPTKAVGVSENL